MECSKERMSKEVLKDENFLKIVRLRKVITRLKSIVDEARA